MVLTTPLRYHQDIRLSIQMIKALILSCILISLKSFVVDSLTFDQSDEASQTFQKLSVGNELKRQTLPLNSGRRIYLIHDIKEHQWYEIKISYPASIPASFSILINNDPNNLWVNKNRRLLDTEKIIFKSNSTKSLYALVTVKSNGIVAKSNVEDARVVYFNIVCDELVLGIPHKAWFVGIAAVFLLALAAAAPAVFKIKHLLMVKASEFCFESDTKAS